MASNRTMQQVNIYSSRLTILSSAGSKQHPCRNNTRKDFSLREEFEQLYTVTVCSLMKKDGNRTCHLLTLDVSPACPLGQNDSLSFSFSLLQNKKVTAARSVPYAVTGVEPVLYHCTVSIMTACSPRERGCFEVKKHIS